MMKHFLRKRNQYLCAVAWMAMGCLPATAAKADEPKTTIRQSAAALDAAALYKVSCSRLERGRTYKLAVVDLTQAVKLAPDQSRYLVALGCADAGRAMALADASYHVGSLAKEQRKYARNLKEWNDAQKNSNSPLFGTPRPSPPIIVTQDDQQPFRLSQDEVERQFQALLTGAFAVWDQSLHLAKTEDERAAALYTRGWGRLLFGRAWITLHYYAIPPAPAEVAKLLDKQNATDDFTTLTRLFPKEPRYWQALGDSYCEMARLDKHAAERENALKAYQKALALNKANAGLWYGVYTLSADNTPALAEQALAEMVAQEPGNAFASYRLANLLIKKTSYDQFHQVVDKALEEHSERVRAEIQSGNITPQDIKKRRMDNFPPYEPEPEDVTARRLRAAGKLAQDEPVIQAVIQCLEQGNKAAAFVTPTYAPPIAPLLAAAWGLRADMYNRGFQASYDMTIVTDAEGYALVATQEGRTAQAARMLQAVLGYGLRLTGPLNTQQMPVDVYETVKILQGCMCCTSIYTALIQLYQTANDSDRAARWHSEMLAFEDRQKRFDAAYREMEQHTYGHTFGDE